MPVKLSFVIPAYNAEQHLESCLRSLLQQNLAPDDFEILVVDNGSEDQSHALLERLSSEIPQLRVLGTDRLGPGGARNLGVDNARGERIWFVDADDFLVPGAAAHLLGVMDAHGLDLLSFGFVRHVPGQGRSLPEKFDTSTPVAAPCRGQAYLTQNNYGAECWRFISARSLHVGGPRFIPKVYCQDSIYVPLLVLRAARVAHVDAPAYVYVVSDTSVTKRKDVAHLAKMSGDMLLIADELRALSRQTKEQGAPVGLSRRLEGRVEALIFFLLMRLLRHGAPLALIRQTLAKAKAAGVLPLKHFGAPEYPELRYRLARALVNVPGAYLCAAALLAALRWPSSLRGYGQLLKASAFCVLLRLDSSATSLSCGEFSSVVF